MDILFKEIFVFEIQMFKLHEFAGLVIDAPVEDEGFNQKRIVDRDRDFLEHFVRRHVAQQRRIVGFSRNGVLGKESTLEAESLESSFADGVLEGVEDDDNGLFQGLLVEKHGVDQLGIEEIAQERGLIPTDGIGIDVHVTEISHHGDLVVFSAAVVFLGWGLEAIRHLQIAADVQTK